MVKPSEVPETVPEMDALSDQQEAAITDFLARVEEQYRTETPYLLVREDTVERRRIFAYKCLKARKWKMAQALEMVDKTVEFRAKHGIDKWKLFPSAFPLRGYDEAKLCSMLASLPGGDHLFPRDPDMEVDRCYRALQTSYVNVYHYWDKAGHPVLYDCCGAANVSEILRDLARITPAGKSLGDIIVPYHTYMNEVQYYLIQYADKVSKDGGGPPIMGITVVMDMAGLSFKVVQRRFIEIIRAIFEVDQAYYPEVLHRLFLLNAPSFFRVAYDWVKGSLDEGTRRKLVFSANKAEAEEMLKRVIDEDKIPREFGGTCQCEGGCLPRYTTTTTPAEHRDASVLNREHSTSEAPTETVCIKRGKEVARSFVLEGGDEVEWEFTVDGTREVQFGASFTPSVGDNDSSAGVSAGCTDDAATVATESATTSKAARRQPASQHSRARLTVKEEKLVMDVDAYRATTAGTLTLTWSNKGAWLYSRQMQLRVQHRKKAAEEGDTCGA
ncbi:CRAL/TRIO domain/Divergent CRAL/TRIO domain containing protein [Novymonas esmeraldas]|uniref:CRAL/TRIO domain/Divergent CRAL/TRIO domain containing protein n=1 Tax=Novymonas esmeraldas TaxID=1808958 RepID=A0AAW0F299_9TRYP